MYVFHLCFYCYFCFADRGNSCSKSTLRAAGFKSGWYIATMKEGMTCVPV